MAEGLRLMAVHAHPDDESSKGAATMARYVDEGVDVLVVTCTGGERGSILNPAMDRPEIVARIAAARDEGDLRENGGYHAAREEQGKQEGRIRQLTDLLRKARVGEPPTKVTDAALGTVITIKFTGDDETEKFLLGSREIAGTTDLTVYSPESALGSAIMGSKPGSSVTYQAPNGRDITVEVVAVEPFVP